MSQKRLFLFNFENSSTIFFLKIFYLENSGKYTEKTICDSLFLNKIASLQPDTLSKKTLAQVFSWDFCENLRNTFLIELLGVTTTKCHLQGNI